MDSTLGGHFTGGETDDVELGESCACNYIYKCFSTIFENCFANFWLFCVIFYSGTNCGGRDCEIFRDCGEYEEKDPNRGESSVSSVSSPISWL